MTAEPPFSTHPDLDLAGLYYHCCGDQPKSTCRYVVDDWTSWHWDVMRAECDELSARPNFRGFPLLSELD